jgi:ribonucleoside-diphosphate reductase alpha chain
MDDVIDNCEYPLPQIKGTVNKERRIGLGVMGVHDVLIAMEKSYDTDEGRDAIAKVLEFIRDEAYRASIDIAKEKGPFPLYDQEKYLSSKFIKTLPLDIQENIKKNKIRNSCILSIAPTGTIGTMYNSSTGCEPWFSLSMQRNTRLGSYEDGCPAYLKWRNEHPDEKIPEYFKTSQDIAPEDHVKMLLLFSKYIDSSVSKCIAEGTLIVTNRGIIPIEAFSSGKHVPDTFYTPNNDYKVIDENGMPQKVISHYCGGQKHCYTLRFENGFEMTVADTHLLKIPCGWISVKDIQKGDKIFYRTNGIGNECNYVPLEQPKFTGLRNEKKYNFPKILNEKYALFLGMWLADGCASKNSIIVCEKNDTVKAVVEELFPLLFGAKAKIQTDKRHGVRSHVLNSRVLVKYFKEKYGTDCVTKKIPEEIMRSPESVHRAFLSGLSLDGYKNRNMLVIYEGYSQQIAKSVASILSMYGIKYYLGNRAVKTGRKAKRTYSIMASLINRDFISPVEPHKKNYALATSTSWPVYISPEIAVKYRTLPKCRISPNHVNPEYISLRNFRSSLSKRCFINQGIVEKVCPRADLNLRCLTVRDKIDAGMKLVYDIGVANTHSYLINGIVSHNTVNLPNSATVEDISKIFLMATKGGAKGITVFRDGSKEGVLISKDSKKEIITEAQKIVEDLQGVKSSEDENDTRVAPKKRGNRVVGATTRIHMQKHNLYVTVNRNKEGDIIETFATVGESKEPDAHHTSGVEDSWAEALGKMISLALRAGVKPDSIVRNLKNIPSDKPVFHTIGDCETSEPIPSPPHAIARVIEEELKYSCPVQYKAEAGPKKGGPCPECGSTNTTQKATCIVCNDCGYSGCG